MDENYVWKFKSRKVWMLKRIEVLIYLIIIHTLFIIVLPMICYLLSDCRLINWESWISVYAQKTESVNESISIVDVVCVVAVFNVLRGLYCVLIYEILKTFFDSKILTYVCLIAVCMFDDYSEQVPVHGVIYYSDLSYTGWNCESVLLRLLIIIAFIIVEGIVLSVITRRREWLDNEGFCK
jgi:hypothetical protein